MANSINWGKAAIKNAINWGKARFVSSIIEPNAYGWGGSYEKSYRGETNIVGVGQEMQKNDYYVYVLEQEGGNYLRGRIDGEFWLDDTTKVFNYWNNLSPYTPRQGSKSFYGTADSGWLAFKTGTNTSEWWGGGMYIYNPPLLYGFPLGQLSVLHMGFRANGSYQTDSTFTVGVGGANDTQTTFTVGDIGSGADFEFERGTSEWQSIEVPVTFLISRGFPASGSMAMQNYLTFSSDTGAYQFALEVDAVYWYNTLGEY